MDYKEWARLFFQHQDIVKRDLVEIKEIKEKNILRIIKKNSEELAIIVGQSELKENLSKIKPEIKTWLILDKSQEKVQEILDNWDDLEKNSELRIILVNTKENSKIAINPHVHSKISDSKDKGLFALLQTN